MPNPYSCQSAIPQWCHPYCKQSQIIFKPPLHGTRNVQILPENQKRWARKNQGLLGRKPQMTKNSALHQERQFPSSFFGSNIQLECVAMQKSTISHQIKPQRFQLYCNIACSPAILLRDCQSRNFLLEVHKKKMCPGKMAFQKMGQNAARKFSPPCHLPRQDFILGLYRLTCHRPASSPRTTPPAKL